MKPRFTLVITSIAEASNQVLRTFSEKCPEHHVAFILAGDRKSPAGFKLNNCDYFSLERQYLEGGALAKLLPESHYCRKNIAYLKAIASGTDVIVETDDDNYPLENFWTERKIKNKCRIAADPKWVNAYALFGRPDLWPRGFDLTLTDQLYRTQNEAELVSPVQQSLANGSPDIDAIQRLCGEQDVSFQNQIPLALGAGTFCPFNSQNTTWFREAFPLLYLPATCNSRLCDIWRSFVVQRVMHACGWLLTFHNASVFQDRNEHDLMRDLLEETEGYLFNGKIVELLNSVDLKKGQANLASNLRTCYSALVREKYLDEPELEMLDAWLLQCKL